MLSIRTARTSRIPPHHFFVPPRRRQAEHTERDLLLLMALQRYEDTICPGCGYSKLLTTNPDYMGHFHVDEAPDCQGCASQDRWRKKREVGEVKPSPGEQHSLIFDDPMGGAHD